MYSNFVFSLNAVSPLAAKLLAVNQLPELDQNNNFYLITKLIITCLLDNLWIL